MIGLMGLKCTTVLFAEGWLRLIYRFTDLNRL